MKRYYWLVYVCESVSDCVTQQSIRSCLSVITFTTSTVSVLRSQVHHMDSGKDHEEVTMHLIFGFFRASRKDLSRAWPVGSCSVKPL